MKKAFLLCMVAALALSMAGCKKKKPEESLVETAATTAAVTETAETAEETETETESAETEAETPEYLNRYEYKDLVFFKKGEELKKPATLYTGTGYSLYIFDEGWSHTTESGAEYTAEVWKNTASKKDVVLKVIELTDKNMPQAQEYIREEMSEYKLIEDKQGGLSGMNSADMMLEVRFNSKNGCVYAVLMEYPSGAKETFGNELYAMADTFKY